jgi:alkylation response protein AidB-like acyl-CoA dehydrogenase
LLVAAREAGSRGAEGIALFAMPAESPGLVREALVTLDSTRRLARLRLDGVKLSQEARVGEGGLPPLERALQRATIALAAEQLGGAQRALDLAVAYAKERVQFGRPIGSFQALKHKLADVMVSVEAARSAVYYAACVAQEDGAALPAAASMAKAVCGDAFRFASASAIQVLGGVGFTWEYDAHLYFKRARSSENLLGGSDLHRERVARAIGL